MDLLSDRNTYEQIDCPDMPDIRTDLVCKIISFNIENPTARKAVASAELSGTVPMFYSLPKVHKQRSAMRPLVPCHSWHMTAISKVPEVPLAHYIGKFPWVINSTIEFIRDLEASNLHHGTGHEEQLWLITTHIESFYNNIDIPKAASRISAIIRGHKDVEQVLSEHEFCTLFKFVKDNVYFAHGKTL